MIVLAAKLEVREQNSDFSASNDQDDKYQEKEAENVVIVIHPDRGKDIIEFNEAGTKRQNTSHTQGKGQAHEPRLIRDLTWAAASLYWESNRVLFVSKKGAEKN